MRNFIRVFVLGLAGVCALLVLAGPAQAVLWGSKTNPLYGYEDGAKFGKAYGNFVNEGGIYATSRSYQYDIQPGGNDVRVETDYYFYETGTSCTSPCWSKDVSLQTDRTDEAAWVFDYRRRGLHGFATAARGGINICEIQSWAPDPCSDHAWVSFSY
jgi:hypothetical protein